MDINKLYQDAVFNITSLININACIDPVFASEPYLTAVTADSVDSGKNNQRGHILHVFFFPH